MFEGIHDSWSAKGPILLRKYMRYNFMTKCPTQYFSFGQFQILSSNRTLCYARNCWYSTQNRFQQTRSGDKTQCSYTSNNTLTFADGERKHSGQFYTEFRHLNSLKFPTFALASLLLILIWDFTVIRFFLSWIGRRLQNVKWLQWYRNDFVSGLQWIFTEFSQLSAP